MNPKDFLIEVKKSKHLDDALGNPPKWITKWGNTVVLLALLLIIGLSLFIKYPDVLPGKITIETKDQAIRVVSNEAGKIYQISVKDSSLVSEGDILVIIENTESWEDIQKVESFINQLDESSFDKINPKEFAALGAIKKSYSELLFNISAYQHFLKRDIVQNKIQLLTEQVNHLNGLNLHIEKRKKLLSSETEIAEKKYHRNLLLLEDNLISNTDFEDVEVVVSQYKRQLESLSSEIIDNEIRINQLQIQILELRKGRDYEVRSQIETVKISIQNVQQDIIEWKNKFLILAPISGYISLSKNWDEKQYLKLNEEVLTILPENIADELIGKLLMPAAGLGKIKIGQRVNIELDGFTYQEFGHVLGRIDQISILPQDEFYVVDIILMNELETTFNKIIEFKPEMTGIGFIITEEKKLFDRIFEMTLNVFK